MHHYYHYSRRVKLKAVKTFQTIMIIIMPEPQACSEHQTSTTPPSPGAPVAVTIAASAASA